MVVFISLMLKSGALVEGFEMAWNSNHKFLEVELDSSIAVNLICKPNDP